MAASIGKHISLFFHKTRPQILTRRSSQHLFVFYLQPSVSSHPRGCRGITSCQPRPINDASFPPRRSSAAPRLPSFHPPQCVSVTVRVMKCRGAAGTTSVGLVQQDCWKCGKTIEGDKQQYFCVCGVVQPPVKERSLFLVRVQFNYRFTL